MRRQASVVARRRINVMPAGTAGDEPVAETNMGTVETVNAETTEDDSRKNKEEIVTTGAKDEPIRAIGNQEVSKNLSRAQINVVRTLVYIAVCFTLCWMPMYFYYLLSTFEV